jgi:fructose 1,6-bisphosphatase
MPRGAKLIFMTYKVYVRKNQNGSFDIFRDGNLFNASVKNQDIEDHLRSHGIFEDFLQDMLRRLEEKGEATEEMPVDTWKQVDVVEV